MENFLISRAAPGDSGPHGSLPNRGGSEALGDSCRPEAEGWCSRSLVYRGSNSAPVGPATVFYFLISEKCSFGLLLQVKILRLLNSHPDSEDSSAFKGSWSLVLLADRITAVIADAQPITR